MTRTRPFPVAPLSANDLFKLRYPRHLRLAVLAALALTALFVWLWPGYQAEPYRLRESEAFEIVDLEPPVDLPDLPEVKAPPRIPPPIEAADPEEADVPDIDWDAFDIGASVDPVPVPPPADEGFVASSAGPRLIRQAKADFPEIARRSGLEGTVVVGALVGPDGTVREAVVIQGVHPILDRAAVDAALRCRFEPARQREIKVRAWVAIPFRFRLR